MASRFLSSRRSRSVSYRYGITVGETASGAVYGGADGEVVYPVNAVAGDIFSLHITMHIASTITMDAGTNSKLVLRRG